MSQFWLWQLTYSNKILNWLHFRWETWCFYPKFQNGSILAVRSDVFRQKFIISQFWLRELMFFLPNFWNRTIFVVRVEVFNQHCNMGLFWLWDLMFLLKIPKRVNFRYETWYFYKKIISAIIFFLFQYFHLIKLTSDQNKRVTINFFHPSFKNK